MIPATEEFKSENFYIKLFYTKCLSESCYYIESEKTALVIDPMRYIIKYNKQGYWYTCEAS